MWEAFENSQARLTPKKSASEKVVPEAISHHEKQGLLNPEYRGKTLFVSLEDMMRMAFTSRPSDYYGGHLLLGGKQCQEVLSDLRYGEGVWQALQSIVLAKVGGSQLTRALTTELIGPEQVVGTREVPTKVVLALEPLLHRRAIRHHPLQPGWSHGAAYEAEIADLTESYYDGALDLERLSKLDYFVLHLMLSLQGSNFDFKFYDQQNNPRRTLEQVTAILRMMFAYPVDGGRRRIVSTTQHGRFPTLRLFDRMAYGGQINVGILDPKIPNRWATATNWRKGTDLAIEADAATGHLGVQVPLDPFTQPLELLLEPQSYSEWALHTVRALRVLTTHKLTEKHCNSQSFLDKKPEATAAQNWNFESVLGVISNLLISFYEDPQTTLTVLEKLDWFQGKQTQKIAILKQLHTLTPHFREEEFQQHFASPKLTGQAGFTSKLRFIIATNPEISLLSQQLHTVEPHLWKESEPQNTDSDTSIQNLELLAPFLYALCPISLTELLTLIPPPDQREHISVIISGASAINSSIPENDSFDRRGRNHTKTAAEAGRAMRQIGYRVQMQARTAKENHQLEEAKKLEEKAQLIMHDGKAMNDFLLPATKSEVKRWQKKQRWYLTGEHFVWN